MKLIPATVADCAHLAHMNQQLIIAEGSDNPMNHAQLTARMQGFLQGTYQAWLFESAHGVVGYTLVDMARNPRYVRHFYVEAPQPPRNRAPGIRLAQGSTRPPTSRTRCTHH
jgi:hypothetical protein